MSDVSAVQLSKWSGRVGMELVKRTRIVDEMTDVRNLNDAEDCKVPMVKSNAAEEVAKRSDRSSFTEQADTVRTLVHNPSIEAKDGVDWEDRLKVPYNHIERKLPIMGSHTVNAHTKRFVSYGVSTVSNFDGASTPNHIISDNFAVTNSSLNTAILNAANKTRELYVDQGIDVNPEEVFLGVLPSLFSRMHNIQELHGHEFRFRDRFGGSVANFRAFEYADMTIFELPVGLNTDMSSMGSASTPAKYKKNLTNYYAFSWWKHGMAQGFITDDSYPSNMGSDTAGATAVSSDSGPEGHNVPTRHVDFDAYYKRPNKLWVLNTAMMYDVLFIYVNGDGDESVASVAWKHVP